MDLSNNFSDFLFWLVLLVGGLVAGGTTGLLGMGGSLMLVPLMICIGIPSIQAVGTSSLAMMTITLFGSWLNWRKGKFDWQLVLTLGLPALITAQFGVYLARFAPPELLLSSIALLLIVSIYFFRLQKHLRLQATITEQLPSPWSIAYRRLFIGSLAGLISGLLGISGGVIIVPSQVLLLQIGFESSVHNSIGVMILSTSSAFIGHEFRGHVLPLEGLVLGIAGIAGIQTGVRLLPHLRNFGVLANVQILVLVICICIYWETRFVKGVPASQSIYLSCNCDRKHFGMSRLNINLLRWLQL